MPLEIERKFRVNGDGWKLAVARRTLLRQGYLANTGRASIRVRIADEQAWISVKAMVAGPARAEYEYAVPVPEAAEMLDALCERPFIEKWRHIVPVAEHEWEIDEFLGDNAGLVVAEIELRAADEDFAMPNWLGAEVTNDRRFYNSSLVRRPWPVLRLELGESG
jgi:adenylate cyclase